METTRKSLQRVTTSKLEPYQRGREGEGGDGWQIEGEAKREVGKTEEGEWPKDNHIKPRTPYQKDG